MTIGPGSRVGPYEVTSVLGEGGMGKVWRAHHTGLKRDDALKVLPEQFATDPERLARFQREAEALASLNHPNIAHIYDLQELDGSKALVMELVEGETIADLIRRGPVTVTEAIRIARQIAHALAAAHACGIIHRDLKPANVKVTPSGQVKVLDFGLAKIYEPDADAPSNNSPTFTSPAVTGRGVILGTAAYMSPEQARGHAVGPQSDVWALGCVLFEMLTGRSAFAGPTVTDVLAAVVRAEPDWSAFPPDTPGRVRSIVKRCLRKDATQRWHHVADVGLELDDSEIEPSGGGAVPKPRAWLPWAVAAAAVAVAAIGGLVMMVRARNAVVTPEMRLEITTPLTPDPLYFALSPDGQQLVAVASQDGVPQLWLRRLDSMTARPLPGTSMAVLPFWSPDGRSIGFFADGKLKRIDLEGGLVQTLTGAPVGAGGTWSRDNIILFSPNAIGPMFSVPAAGGTPTQVTKVGSMAFGHRLPRFLPDHRHFLFFTQTAIASGRGVYVGSLDGGDPQRLMDADSAAVYVSNHLLFVRQGTLYAQPFDASRRELAGEPFAIADQMGVDTSLVLAGLTASDAGTFAYRAGGARGGRQLTWYDRAGNRLGTIGQIDLAMLLNPELSADGKFVAVNRIIDSNSDIWLLETARGNLRRFTFDAGVEQLPVWSGDGHIVFSSNRNTVYNLYRRAGSGPGADELLLESAENKFPMDVSTDSRFLLYRNTGPNTNWDLWALPLAPKAAPIRVTDTPHQEMIGAFSPDGRWVAYQSTESGAVEIYIQSFPSPTVRTQVSTKGGAQPRWRRDGKELFFVALDSRLMAAALNVDANGQILADEPVPLFAIATPAGPVPSPQKHQYAVSADGKRFLINRLADDSVNSPITLVLNWKPQSASSR